MITEFSKITGYSVDDLLGHSRRQALADHRHVYWWVLYRSGYSCAEIARLNERTHANTSRAIKRIDSLLMLNDKVIVAILDKIKPLIENIKDEKIMSAIKQFIELSQPTTANSARSVVSGSVDSCNTCHGKGYIYQGGYIKKFKKDLNEPDYNYCSVCGGTGKMKAVVTVTWECAGDIVELPKDNEP